MDVLARLSPRLNAPPPTDGFFQTDANFFKRRNFRKQSYVARHKLAARVQPDPISVLVEENRHQGRARSTLRATPRLAGSTGQRGHFLHKGDGLGQNFFQTGFASVGKQPFATGGRFSE